MKQSLITKFFNYILMILGFTGSVSCEPLATCMYGTPTMDFEVSGKVVNQDSAPIAGIKVSCPTYTAPGIASTLTAEDGSFSISGRGYGPQLRFEDIDGPDNGGEFAELTEYVEGTQVGEGDGHWYKGRFEARDVVITMEKK